MNTHVAPEAQERVLSTLNRDGSRRWLRPKLSPGRYHRRRQMVAYLLIVVFTAIPYLKMNGKPLVLLDIVHRQFTLLGQTFYATDTLFLMLLMISILVGIFLLTAIFGRVWCGWACPQTVYMEYVFRPLERWIEGGRARQLQMDKHGPNGRRFVRYLVFLLVSMFLAHTFLAYFVGVEQLAQWVQRSPFEHPTAFLVMAGVTLAMMFDFGFFREQTCLVACPYGRLQSVLLDRQSLVVGYDPQRGEPRGRGKAQPDQQRGDCIDCFKCVTTCPTGIDIREGLQMECIHCTQCIDACDDVMDRIGKPRGLIRYSSQAELAGEGRRFLRPRVVLYPAVLMLAGSALIAMLVGRAPAEVAVVREKGKPFEVLHTGEIRNSLRVRVTNRTGEPREYRFELLEGTGMRILTAQNPLVVRAGETDRAAMSVLFPQSALVAGRGSVTLRVSDDDTFTEDHPVSLLGPRQKSQPSSEEGQP